MLLTEKKDLESSIAAYAAEQLPEGYTLQVFITPIKAKNDKAAEHTRADKVRDLVCSYYDFPLKKVLNHRRKQLTSPLTLVKFSISLMIRTYTTLTLAEVAAYTGGCEHSTIMYHIKTLRGWCKVDGETKSLICGLETFIEDNLQAHD